MALFQHQIFDERRMNGKKILDIGCGRHKLPGAVGVDQLAVPGVDVVTDLNKALPFKDGEFEVVHSNQVLEHIPNLIGLMEEMHRVLAPGGMLVAHVPYFRSSWAAIDPTHVRQFTINSLDYFAQGTFMNEGYRFSDVRYSSIEIYLDGNYPKSIFRWFFTKLALRFPNRFENTFLSFLYPFQTLTFVLRK
ncbi:MAG: hypothetical protein COT73_00400 [Bdellovibrio sp. CG10_big_fil_rev_8_21_14_0_10_47_8]|nr:MAG: hypothetical protein COT73_00400 [Bdellovibrio sp. CG10_big_fil_rev_8_21_14_0_10_47_8]